MLARKRSLVSCSVVRARRGSCSFHRLARIDATAGLQISQPLPRAVLREQLARTCGAAWPATISNSSWRRVARSARTGRLTTALPRALELRLEQVGHERHAAAAAGAGLGARLERGDRVSAPCAIAAQIVALACTLLHEQTCAVVGQRVCRAPRRRAGRASSSSRLARQRVRRCARAIESVP